MHDSPKIYTFWSAHGFLSHDLVRNDGSRPEVGQKENVLIVGSFSYQKNNPEDNGIKTKSKEEGLGRYGL